MKNTYKLAVDDRDFLESDACRGIRLQLEYLKPEEAMREKRVVSTVVIFGSARICSEADALKALDEARQKFAELFGRDLVEPIFIVRQLCVDGGRIAVAELFTE